MRLLMPFETLMRRASDGKTVAYEGREASRLNRAEQRDLQGFGAQGAEGDPKLQMLK